MKYRSMYPYQMPPDVRARHERVQARAIEVFGNSLAAGIWLGTFNPAVAAGKQTPQDFALDTDAGLEAVLAELDRLAPSIDPVPPKPARWGRKARRG